MPAELLAFVRSVFSVTILAVSLINSRLLCAALLLSIPASLGGALLLGVSDDFETAGLALSVPLIVPALLIGLRHERAQEAALLTAAALFPATGAGSLAPFACFAVGLLLTSPRPPRLLMNLLCALTGGCVSWLLLLSVYAGGVSPLALGLASAVCSGALFGAVWLLRRRDLMDLWVGIGGIALILGVLFGMNSGEGGWPAFWQACGLSLGLPGLLLMSLGVIKSRYRW